ncbi:MAG: hypothetical protein HWE22_06665 [Flavobacteriales bacterium]|nr:hypothetical protein [Flavobacteriales bacterium]
MEKEIIGDFFQGTVIIREETKACLDDYKNGNCVTIALIKTALVQFGSIDKIFASYVKKDGITEVLFKDGTKARISEEEKNVVRNISGIKHIDDAVYYETAIELFALIAMRVYELKSTYSEKCIHSFQHAVEFLNSGYPTEKSPELLGLARKPIKVKRLNNYKSAIIYSSAHTAYCCYGYQDQAGKSNKVNRVLGVSWMKNMRGIGGVVSGAFILKEIES